MKIIIEKVSNGYIYDWDPEIKGFNLPYPEGFHPPKRKVLINLDELIKEIRELLE